MGGKTAIKFACENPECVSSLVLMDSAPVDNTHYLPSYCTHLAEDLQIALSIELENRSRKQVFDEMKNRIADKANLAAIGANLLGRNNRLYWR
jgi:pimeloyl-ACP methyl ester carboxylesterase